MIETKTILLNISDFIDYPLQKSRDKKSKLPYLEEFLYHEGVVVQQHVENQHDRDVHRSWLPRFIDSKIYSRIDR